MANKLQTSIRAYAADNIQIKRFLRVEDAQQLFHRACQLKCVSFLFPLVFEGCSVDCTD